MQSDGNELNYWIKGIWLKSQKYVCPSVRQRISNKSPQISEDI
jgi:hypothetical protein